MSTSSSSATLASSLQATKRPVESAGVSGDRKRQKKVKEDKKNSQRTNTASSFNSRWLDKVEKLADWRRKLGLSLESPRDRLLATLDQVRAADNRPALSEFQKRTLPASAQLDQLFLDIFMSPLSWSPASYGAVLLEQTHSAQAELAALEVEGSDENVETDDTDDIAQFYLRRLAFPSHLAVQTLFEELKERNPHYTGQADMLISASSHVLFGDRFISYGGYTIANTVIGRQLDDEGKPEGSFLKAVLKLYDGSVTIYEVLPLRFRIGEGGHSSILAGRSDPRTMVFESLVIESLGFICLNTAPPGSVLDLIPQPDWLKMQKVVEDRTYTTSSFDFPWKKGESST